jgi:hypothetical protein
MEEGRNRRRRPTAALLTTAVALALAGPAAAQQPGEDVEPVLGPGPTGSPLPELLESTGPDADPAQPDLGAPDPSFEEKTIRGFGFAESRTLGGTYEMEIGQRTVQFDKHNGADQALGTSSSFRLSPLQVAPPACTSSGRRFVAVYAYPQRAANRANQVRPEIQTNIWRANGKLAQEALLAGGVSRTAVMRVDCDGLGQVEVPSVAVPRTCEPSGDPGLSPDGTCHPDYAGHVAWAVERALGSPQGSDSVKYVIFYDQPETGWSGVGFGYFTGDGDTKIRRDNPNRNYTTSAILYPEFWDSLTLVHEIGHVMGAVQNTAPHSSGASHCVDGNDIMCYRDRADSSFSDTDPNHCPNDAVNALGFEYDSAEGMPFDCGYDDYFRTSPGNGYLDSHWNTGGWENDLLAFVPEWPTPVNEPGYGPPDLEMTQKAGRRGKAKGAKARTLLISVRNVGAGPSTGETSLFFEAPRGTKLKKARGSGWQCRIERRTGGCTRTAPLQPQTKYPPVKVDLTGRRRVSSLGEAAAFTAGDLNPVNNYGAAMFD